MPNFKLLHKMVQRIHELGVDFYVPEKKPIRSGKNNAKKRVARKLKCKQEIL